MTAKKMILFRMIFFLTSVFIYSSHTFGNTGNSAANNDSLKVSLQLRNFTPKDTFALILVNKFYTNQEAANSKIYYKQVGENGLINFKLQTNRSCGYWIIAQIKKITYQPGLLTNITEPFFYESGDDIRVNLTIKDSHSGVHSSLAFSGTGKEKYIIKLKLDTLLRVYSKEFIQDSIERKYNLLSSNVVKRAFSFIDRNTSIISPKAINVLKQDILFAQGKGIEVSINQLVQRSDFIRTTQNIKNLLQLCYEIEAGRGLIEIDSNTLADSYGALHFVNRLLNAESWIHFNRRDPLWVYDTTKERYKGKLRDRLILASFTTSLQYKNTDSLFRNATSFINDKESTEELQNLEPFFTNAKLQNHPLTDQNGKEINLNSYLGKVVLVDLWYNGCGSCAEFYTNALKKVEEKFVNDPDVVFVSISIDKKYDDWQKGIKSNLYTSEHVVNLYTGKQGSAHPFIAKYAIRGFPTAILLDRKGKVAYFNTNNLYKPATLTDAINALK